MPGRFENSLLERNLIVSRGRLVAFLSAQLYHTTVQSRVREWRALVPREYFGSTLSYPSTVQTPPFLIIFCPDAMVCSVLGIRGKVGVVVCRSLYERM